MEPIIIIGAGLAGYTVAREFRKLDKTSSLLIITADDGHLYSKPMLSNAFSQGKTADQLVTQTAVAMAEQLNATILTGTRVDQIDTDAKAIITGSGTYQYGKLVIATGAQAIRLNIKGDAANQVLSVNHIHDYVAFRKKIAQHATPAATRITILGAGLIGCEFADDLAGSGHLVTLVDPNRAPLSALAAPALSEGLHAALISRGISLQLNTTATRIDSIDHINRADNQTQALKVTLANNNSFDTDIVLSAVGLRPDLHLAQVSGLSTGRGIIVDDRGQTSAPDVYALGDCAEYTIDGGAHVLPYIAPLMTAARAIASTLSGKPVQIALKPAPVIVKTPSYPLALMPPLLHTLQTGKWEVESSNGRIVCRFYDAQDLMTGFGVAPHEASVRTELMSAYGKSRPLNQAA